MEVGSKDSIFGNFENNANFLLEPSHDPFSALDNFPWSLDNFSYQQNLINSVTNDYDRDIFSGFSSVSDVTDYYSEDVFELNTNPQDTSLALKSTLNGGSNDFSNGESNLDCDFNVLVKGRPNIRIETIEKNGTSMYWIKGQWTTEEDRKLTNLVNQYGYGKWAAIAKHMVGRVGKQCRQRWDNHLRPDLKKDIIWSEDEERLLIEAHKRLGNKWTEIAKCIPGRSENSIKNHWNATKRKQTSTRKIKRPHRLGQVMSTLLEDYIKNKYFNNGASFSNSNSNANVDVVTPQPVLQINEDESIFHFNLDAINEEMNFMDVLFENNDNVNGTTMASTNMNAFQDNIGEIGNNAVIPRQEAEDEFFSSDIFLSDYMIE